MLAPSCPEDRPAHAGAAGFGAADAGDVVLVLPDEEPEARASSSYGVYEEYAAPRGAETPVASATSASGTIGILPLLAITYFVVCGGPFGLEEAVSEGHSLYTLIALFVVPLVFTLPMGLMVAELGTMMPENGGYVHWVHAALGPAAGFLEGLLKWLNGVADNALRPALAVSYLARIHGSESPWVYWGTSVAAVGVVALANIIGLEVAGMLSIALTFVMLLPFVIMTALGLLELPFEHVLDAPPTGEIHFGVFLAVMLWNYSGIDASSAIFGQVRRPSRNIPIAMVLSTVAVVLTYAIPMLVIVPRVGAYKEWEAGYWPDAGNVIGGTWLKVLTALGGGAAAVGMFNSVLLTSSWALHAICAPEYLGLRPLCWVSRLGTPVPAILLNSFLCIALLNMSFEVIVQVASVYYTTSVCLQVVALWVLRVRRRHAERPYRIPLPLPLLVVVFLPTLVLTGFLLATVSFWLLLLSSVPIAAGMALYFARTLACLLRVRVAARLDRGRLHASGPDDGTGDESVAVVSTLPALIPVVLSNSSSGGGVAEEIE
jgi:amino acid transporter